MFWVVTSCAGFEATASGLGGVVEATLSVPLYDSDGGISDSKASRLVSGLARRSVDCVEWRPSNDVAGLSMHLSLMIILAPDSDRGQKANRSKRQAYEVYSIRQLPEVE